VFPVSLRVRYPCVMQSGRLLLTLVFFQLETLGYLLVNRLSARRPSVPLLTPGDGAVPFSARSLWLYLSFVPYCFFALLDIERLRTLLRLFVCIGIDSAVSYRSFLKYPSAYPRTPVAADGPELARTWATLRSVDRPSNTFPSVHVGHAALIALVLSRHLTPERARPYLLWATLVSLSTLTTQQHFLVDVTGGLLVAETIVADVYQPWIDGRLRWREAMRRLRALCARLDAMACSPGLRLPPAEGASPLRGLVAEIAEGADLRALYRATTGRQVLLEHAPLLAERLRRSGRIISLLTRIMPGWLQFVRLFEQASGSISDGSAEEYLAGIAPELHRAAALLVNPSTAPLSGADPTAGSRAAG